jgi:hypothetical protein
MHRSEVGEVDDRGLDLPMISRTRGGRIWTVVARVFPAPIEALRCRISRPEKAAELIGVWVALVEWTSERTTLEHVASLHMNSRSPTRVQVFGMFHEMSTAANPDDDESDALHATNEPAAFDGWELWLIPIPYAAGEGK